jgi:hypothetical protein
LVLNQIVDLRCVDIPAAKVWLENEGFIKVSVSNQITIRDKSYRLFSSTVDINELSRNFDELFETYPSNIGTRKLRPVHKEGDQYEDLKKRYLRKVKTTEKHKLVLSSLRKEIASRTASGELKYLQMLSTWINNSSWELWLGNSEVSVNFMDEDL